MKKCDRDCDKFDSLAADVAAIKEKQEKTHDVTLRMDLRQENLMEKFDEYMTQNSEDHKTFWERTRLVVTWPFLGKVALGCVTAAGVIVGIIFTISGG